MAAIGTEEWARRLLEQRAELAEALRVINAARPRAATSVEALMARLTWRETRYIYRAPLSRVQFDVLVGAAIGETPRQTAERLRKSDAQDVNRALDAACERLDASTPSEAVRAAWRMGIFRERDMKDAIGRR